ncbi:unnamed protein product [Anisakis simplex]|uniref:Secreted protein n=1 Tax=Anisakis simplex TaxID=6269 RepID=A0A0M3J856_ANISI|nr:unnamed protein product [Anisakis simplex]
MLRNVTRQRTLLLQFVIVSAIQWLSIDCYERIEISDIGLDVLPRTTPPEVNGVKNLQRSRTLIGRSIVKQKLDHFSDNGTNHWNQVNIMLSA